MTLTDANRDPRRRIPIIDIGPIPPLGQEERVYTPSIQVHTPVGVCTSTSSWKLEVQQATTVFVCEVSGSFVFTYLITNRIPHQQI